MACDNCGEVPVYNKTLTVEQPSTARDAAGQTDLTVDANWDLVGRIRARFITKGGSESYVFKQTLAETTHVIVCNATAVARQIDPSFRLTLGSRKFEITASFLVNESGKVWQIEAKEAK
jgi:head-tail adaptor